MKIAGFTFIRNAEKFAYPVVESIQSILPLCDELIVMVGKSEDNTLDLIRSIEHPAIKIYESVWDDSLREGGKVLAVETNKALDKISPDVDWCIYIQADEVLHEQYLPALRQAMERHLHNPRVEGLLVNYLHFWGNFSYVGTSRRWYRREIRIIRNDPAIRSYRDAQGFRKDDRKLRVKLTPAVMYHYGWVRPPAKQQLKRRSSNRYWHSDEWIEKHLPPVAEFDYQQVDLVAPFLGSHPQVMQARIEAIDWEFTPPPSRLSFKNRLLHWLERKTGWRVGEYRNYTII